MDEQELLKRLRSEIGPELAPVRPFSPPGARALWLMVVWLALGAGVFMLLGPRQDIGVLGAWRSIGLSLVELVACFMLAVVAFRLAVPAMAGSTRGALAWVAVALGLHLVISWVTLDRSAMSPPHGQEWRDGLTCLASIAALGAAPLVMGAALLARGLLRHYLVPFLLTGFASGLAGEAIWRLHCPYSAWDHVLLFHSGALLLFLLLGSVAAWVVRRGA